MTIKTIQNIPYIEKKQMVTEACLLYNKLRITHDILFRKGEELSDSFMQKSKHNSKTISIFETVKELLNEEEKLVFQKDFLEENNPLWYLDYFSKTTYYKIKHQAIDKFLYLFYA